MSVEQETSSFIVKNAAEIIGGIIVILLGWYTRMQGKKAPVYMSEGEVELRMELCKTQLLVRMATDLQAHEDRIVERVSRILALHVKK